MSKTLTYKDHMAFHPAYYIEELLEFYDMNQEDLARRLGTTPKNLSILLTGNQRLTVDMAMKLGKMFGTGTSLWLNLQRGYDEMVLKMQEDAETEREKAVFRYLDYPYLKRRFSLKDQKTIEEKIEALRTYLNISSLCVLKDSDLTIRYKKEERILNERETVLTNILILSAVNEAQKIESGKYDKKAFKRVVNAIRYGMDREFIIERFKECGVILRLTEDMPGSKIKGAVKAIGGRMLIVMCGQKKEEDFLRTLFHECAHVLHGEYGICLKDHSTDREDRAESYAKQRLQIIRKKQHL